MSRWDDFKGKVESGLGKWLDGWDPEAGKKSIAASAVNIVAQGVGYPEHDGWRKEVRQNIANRKIDREPNPFKDQLTNSLKGIKPPSQEIGKDREIER
jgi:hypothetical protein